MQASAMPAQGDEAMEQPQQQPASTPSAEAAPPSPVSPTAGQGVNPAPSGAARRRGAPPTASTLAVHSKQTARPAAGRDERSRTGSSTASHSTYTSISDPTAPSVVSVGQYFLTELLGEGTFAKVHRGLNQETNTMFAVKVIQKAELVKQPNASGKTMLYREIGVLECLKGHPNIVELKEIMQTKSNIYIVMEIADGGDLLTRIHPNKGMPEDEARRYFQQIISAVDYCHKMQIAHRDIKPDNIIMTPQGVIKMTDFGLSNLQMINEAGTVSQSLRLKTICGTPHYVAPEVFTDTRMGYNGFLADVWSCGVVLYAMLSGGLPFRGTKETAVLKRITSANPQPCGWIPDQAWTLINSLLTKDPQSRMQIPGVLVDPWFSVGFDRSVIRTDISREKTLRLMAITKKRQAAHTGNPATAAKPPGPCRSAGSASSADVPSKPQGAARGNGVGGPQAEAAMPGPARGATSLGDREDKAVAVEE